MAGQFAECVKCGGRAVGRIAAGLDVRNSNLGGVPTEPIDQQHGFVGRFVEFSDNLRD